MELDAIVLERAEVEPCELVLRSDLVLGVILAILFAYTVILKSKVQAMLVPSPSSLCSTLSQIPDLVVQQAQLQRLRLVSHRISAGFPSPAADYAEEGLDLNDFLVRNKPASFMFTVKGDSMINAGIVEGDKVIVDRSLNARSKDIVVAVVNGEYTIKRLHKTASKVELRPENPAYQPIVFKEGSELEVWGVVVGVVRRYGNQS